MAVTLVAATTEGEFGIDFTSLALLLSLLTLSLPLPLFTRLFSLAVSDIVVVPGDGDNVCVGGVAGDGFVTLSSFTVSLLSSSSCTRTGLYCFRLDIFDFVAILFLIIISNPIELF